MQPRFCALRKARQGGEEAVARFLKGQEEKKDQQRVVSKQRVADQKAVDAVLVKEINKTPLMARYLKSSFSLTNGVYPHNSKF